MTPTTVRRTMRLVTAASLLAGVAAAATARPVAAADGLGTYSVTFEGVAAGRGGGVGASGGLVSLSGGPGDVSGRLDAAPSAAAQASSVEPGTMYRLVAGQVNGATGDQVIGEPTTARAEYPGEVTEDDATQADAGDTGPLRVVGGTGRAAAAADRATARAGLAGLVVTPDEATTVLRLVGAYADGVAEAPATGPVEGRVEVGVALVEVLDQLVVRDVVGTATVRARGEVREAEADLVVGSVAVAGVPVTIGEDGVVATGEGLVPGQDVDDATAQANAVLAGAGIQVWLLGAREEVDGTRGLADSGGIGIRVTTPAAPGVPRNDLELFVGRGTATVFAEPPPATTSDAEAAAAPAATPSPTTTSTAPTPSPDPDRPARGPTPVTGSAPPPAPSAPAPSVAPSAPADAVPDAGPAMVVAGRRMSPRTAYAGFASWLLFTSVLPMTGAAWLRRRPRS